MTIICDSITTVRFGGFMKKYLLFVLALFVSCFFGCDQPNQSKDDDENIVETPFEGTWVWYSEGRTLEDTWCFDGNNVVCTIKTFEGDSILFTDELKGTFSFTDTKLTVKFTSNNGKTGNDDLEIKYMLDYFSISDNDYTLDNAVITIQRVYDESPVEYVLHKKL